MKVYVSPSTATKFVTVALPGVISPAMKPVTVSLNWTVTGMGVVFVEFGAAELIATVGIVLSTNSKAPKSQLPPTGCGREVPRWSVADTQLAVKL